MSRTHLKDVQCSYYFVNVRTRKIITTMAEPSPPNELINKLQEQLTTARNEIHNLRQQIKSLTYVNQKELKKIEDVLCNWKCKNCQEKTIVNLDIVRDRPNEESSEDILLHPIGTISTDFSEKRGIPRQPRIGSRIQGKIKLNNKIFTNPEHALEGLEEFSHMWILFHFHRNGSNHVMAKVAPPRLNGIRTGVFGTRSPHRPSPIGLSLVQINHIDGSTIYFSGVDMLDGTPVLDIKPYIPTYDNPLQLTRSDLEEVCGRGDPLANSTVVSVASSSCGDTYGEREAPDGEESEEQGAPLSVNIPADSLDRIVRVPFWVTDPPVSQLNVTFSPSVEEELDSNTKEIITGILKEDPRSVYLRERYGNQFYTFLIQGLHVSCKFDDSLQTVNVYRIALAKKLCSCGVPEWQCSEHQAE